MASSPALILETLDRHMTGPGHLRLFGGAALILGYERARTTEDADVLVDDAELQALIDESNFGEALEKTNRELEPRGLYLRHIFGPEQEILTPTWRENCRPLSLGLSKLSASVLGPMDLIVSKLARADRADLDDIAWVVQREGLVATEVLSAAQGALVPEILRDTWRAALPKLEKTLHKTA